MTPFEPNDLITLILFVDLLEKVLSQAKENTNETETMPTDGSARRRNVHKSPSRKEQPTEPDYTAEQLQHVKRIKR